MHSRLLLGWLLLGWLLLGAWLLHAAMPSAYVYSNPFSSFPHFPDQAPPSRQQLDTPIPEVLHLGHTCTGLLLVGAFGFFGGLLTGGLLTGGLLTGGLLTGGLLTGGLLTAAVQTQSMKCSQ